MTIPTEGGPVAGAPPEPDPPSNQVELVEDDDDEDTIEDDMVEISRRNTNAKSRHSKKEGSRN